MPVDPASAEKVLAAIEKDYGDTIHAGDEFPEIPRIPTGSLALDFATQGGIPIGRVSRFYGGYHGGKSLFVWFAIKKAQEMGMDCCYYNVEKQYDAKYVKALGVDTKKLKIVDGTEMEEIGAKLEALIGVYHFHAIDSLTSAVSREELAAKIEDWGRALNARVWAKVFRRVNDRFDSEENTIILVDQIRANMAYGGGDTVPGGKFLEHMSSMSIKFSKGKWCYHNDKGILEPDGGSDKTLSESKEADGYEIQARIEKSRVGRPFRAARMRYDFAKQSLDATYELSRAARHFEIVERAGAWYSLPSGERVQGDMNLRAAIEADEKLREQIVQQTMAAM